MACCPPPSGAYPSARMPRLNAPAPATTGIRLPRLRVALLSSLVLAALLSPARGAGVVLGPVTSKNASEGEVLLGTLNCTACHSAREPVRQRLGARPGPLLGAEGLRLTPQWIRTWLEDHARTQPGSPMPDVLHGLDPAARAGAAEALTHFLVSRQPAGEAEGVGADRARLELGRRLYHSIGCVACHAPQERGPDIPEDVYGKARAQAVPLGDLARKYPAAELARFLADPVRHRPAGRMPSLGLTTAEALAVATYLVRDQAPGLADPNQPLKTIAGLGWEYFEASFRNCGDFDRLKPVADGETGELSLKPARRGSNYGLRFTGVLEVPAEGEYTFWTSSDDGSTLDLDGRRVVDNDGEHGEVEKQGKVRLAAGPHTFEVRFFQNGGGAEFKVRWAGPGFDRQPIPSAALKRYGEPLTPLGNAPFSVDAEKARQGRDWFAKLNCGACHAGTDVPGQPARALLELASRSDAGCLAEKVPAAAPRYDLSPAQRTALRRTVAAAQTLGQPLRPAAEAVQTLARLNCLACHQRQGEGGPAELGREAWFGLVGEADLGEEGRIPPRLDGVGGKLRPEWLARVLSEGAKVRPYMATRMPVYGGANVGHLPAVLERADLAAQAAPEPAFAPREAKFGRKLVGRDGLSCVACHTFSTYGSLGIPALSLDRMYERLRWDWFRRYLPDPAALRPGTRMPSFWPEGRAANTEILNGDVDQQIRAIFAWMKDGPKADVPAGLIRSRQELVADREAVIYRHFIEGAGSRAIGVGYPEKANLAFDANQLRLALLWQGAFIDTARHSTDRGAGFEPPLGDHLIRLPEGAPFAVLPAPDAPWPSAAGRAAGYQFRGYTLDALRRPAFRYSFGGVEVEDMPVPAAAEVDIRLTRTLKFRGTAPAGRLWFRAAQGNLQAGPDGAFLLDGRVRLRFPGGGQPVLVNNELRVPVTVPGELVQEITW